MKLSDNQSDYITNQNFDKLFVTNNLLDGKYKVDY